jgi:hypothetical protein
MKIIAFLLLFFGSTTSFCQEKITSIIKFKVEEIKNNPFPGVSISVKGTLIETTTDFDGEAFLELDNFNQIIILSFLGPQYSFKLIKDIDLVYIDIVSRRVTYYKNGKKIKRKKLKSDGY